jgi:hypothetical protein
MSFVSIYSILLISLSVIIQPIYALYFDNDVTVTNHVELHPSSSASFSSPKQLAATEKGEVYVVWVGNNSIHFTSYENHKKFGPKLLLSEMTK